MWVSHVAFAAADMKAGIEAAAATDFHHITEVMLGCWFADQAMVDFVAGVAYPLKHRGSAIERGSFFITGDK